MAETRIDNFTDFYPYYLQEHSDLRCRVLHFIGTFLVIDCLLAAWLFKLPMLLLLVPLIGYGFAWVGHFFFEKNRPATFKYPFYSLAADFRLFFDMICGKHWSPGPTSVSGGLS